MTTLGTRGGESDEVARLAAWLTSNRPARQLLQAALYATARGPFEIGDEAGDE